MGLKRASSFISFFIILLLLPSCKSYSEKSENRGKKTERLGGDIVIGVATSSTQTDDMVDGVRLKIDEFNASGGLKGRKMRYIKREDNNNPATAIRIAREFTENENLIAVIGHLSTDVAIPASVVYEFNGIVFITPRSTNPLLTGHGFNYVFRNRPSDSYTALWLAKYMYDMGYKDIIVIDDNSAYGTGLASSFHTYASDLGLNIKQWLAYHRNKADHREVIINMMSAGKCDAVLIAATVPEAAVFIKQAREMGVKAPFIGGNGIHSPLLWKIAGKTAEGVVTTVEINTEDNNTKTREFVRQFETKYKRPPHEMAALGYDAVELLIYGFTKGGSTKPEVIAANIRYIDAWESVCGHNTRKENGDIGDKIMYFETMHNGEFKLQTTRKHDTYEEVTEFFKEKLSNIHKEKER